MLRIFSTISSVVGILAAAVAGEINGLGAVECQLHVLQHLALVQLHVQDGLDGILAGGLADGVVGEGPAR